MKFRMSLGIYDNWKDNGDHIYNDHFFHKFLMTVGTINILQKLLIKKPVALIL